MTNQPTTTYIDSDANCVLFGTSKEMPKNANLIEWMKANAVKFADQDYAGGVIALKYGTIKPNTIYTVEGYDVLTTCNLEACGTFPCLVNRCKELGVVKTAHLFKRIEPVVSVEQESDQTYYLPFAYRDSQVGDILKANQPFTVQFLVDRFVSIKCEGQDGYPLNAEIFKLYAVKLNPPKQ